MYDDIVLAVAVLAIIPLTLALKYFLEKLEKSSDDPKDSDRE